MATHDTRMALAQALRRQLQHTPLGKISVSSLCHDAGIQRQTFYYHFNDIYSLAAWVFQEEVANKILSHATYEEWATGFKDLLDYLEAHRAQTYSVLASLSHRDLEKFFFHTLRPMMEAIVAQLLTEENTQEPPLHPDDKEMVIDHYTITVLGHLFHWLAHDMHIEPEALVRQIEYILRGHVRHSIQRLQHATPPHRCAASEQTRLHAHTPRRLDVSDVYPAPGTQESEEQGK